MEIYRLTNTTNGKVYIGKTVDTLRKRWKEHRGLARHDSDSYLHRAIRKYGSDAFKVEVIYRAKTADELSKMETFFIVLHQSHKVENGYNMTLGGGGIIGLKRSPEWCQRLSRAKLGVLNPMYGQQHSAEAKQSIAAFVRKNRRGKNNPNFNKPRSEQTRRKIGDGVRRAAENRRMNHVQ